jgi:hypothetical protein
MIVILIWTNTCTYYNLLINDSAILQDFIALAVKRASRQNST